MSGRKGGCLCGAVRYEITADPVATAVCHCTHCQRQSGAAFSVNVVVPEANFVQTGETKVFVDSGDSGLPVNRHFCGHCGSPIASQVGTIPGMVMVKAGTLDDMSGITPAIEVYADHAADWAAPIAGARRFGQAAG
jgi:hypothetical protein